MSLFLKDIVHDLREKKLWPVAALLLLAIVAVPAVLLRSPSQEAGPTGAEAPAPGQAKPAALALSADEERASALEAFSAKDPFKPRGPAAPRRTSEPDAPSAGTGASGTAAGGGIDTSALGGVRDLLGQGGGQGSGGASGSPSTPSQQVTPRSEERETETKTKTETKEVAYTHTVDVRFGRRGQIRLRRDIARLQPIPSEERPLLVYLGTTPSGYSAVFLVDQSLEQRGDGICKPSRSNCALLYLRPEDGHDLHYFTDTLGRGYALRLVSIDLVPLSEVTEEESKASARRSGRDATRWPFQAGSLVDLVR